MNSDCKTPSALAFSQHPIIAYLEATHSEVGLVVLDSELNLLWMNAAQEEQLKALTGASFESVRSSKCYKAWNSFTDACHWCPVVDTRKDNQMHIGRAASPSTDATAVPSLLYSHIVSIPLTSEAWTESYLLEVIFFDRGQTTRQYRLFVDPLRSSEALGKIIPQVHNVQFLIDLVLLGLLTLADANITSCSAHRISTPGPLEAASVANRTQALGKDSIAGLPENFIEGQIERPEPLERWWSRFASKGLKSQRPISAIISPDRCTHLPRTAWLPKRLDRNTMAIVIPTPAYQDNPLPESWLIIAVNEAQNNFILRDDLTKATLFFASLRRHVELLVTVREQTIARTNLESTLKTIGNPLCLEAVPFALGKVHTLGDVIKRQTNTLSKIESLAFSAEAKLQLNPYLEQLHLTFWR